MPPQAAIRAPGLTVSAVRCSTVCVCVCLRWQLLRSGSMRQLTAQQDGGPSLTYTLATFSSDVFDRYQGTSSQVIFPITSMAAGHTAALNYTTAVTMPLLSCLADGSLLLSTTSYTDTLSYSTYLHVAYTLNGVQGGYVPVSVQQWTTTTTMTNNALGWKVGSVNIGASPHYEPAEYSWNGVVQTTALSVGQLSRAGETCWCTEETKGCPTLYSNAATGQL